MSDDLKPCSPDVYAHGYIFAVDDMTKVEAEAFCKEKTAETGNYFDWHYAGGHVVIKCLTKEKVAELLAEHNRNVEFEKLKELNTELLAVVKEAKNFCIQRMIGKFLLESIDELLKKYDSLPKVEKP